jgi:hypothetical protein
MTSQCGETNQKPRKIHWEFYDDETPAAVIRFFEERIWEMEKGHPAMGERYRIFYGNRDTGALNQRVGPDEGYIALATGERFMLLYNANSTRGPGVMMRNIIKIERCSSPHGQRTVYRHPRFHEPTPEEVLHDPSLENTDQRQASRIVIRSEQHGT